MHIDKMINNYFKTYRENKEILKNRKGRKLKRKQGKKKRKKSKQSKEKEYNGIVKTF